MGGLRQLWGGPNKRIARRDARKAGKVAIDRPDLSYATATADGGDTRIVNERTGHLPGDYDRCDVIPVSKGIAQAAPPSASRRMQASAAKANLRVRSRPGCWYRRRSSAVTFVDHRTDVAPISTNGQSIAFRSDCFQPESPVGLRRPF